MRQPLTVRRVVVWNNGPNDDQIALADLGGDHNTIRLRRVWKGRIILTVGSFNPAPPTISFGGAGSGLNIAVGHKVLMLPPSWATGAE